MIRMPISSADQQRDADPDPSRPASILSHRLSLIVARIAWVILTILIISVTIFGALLRLEELRGQCIYFQTNLSVSSCTTIMFSFEFAFSVVYIVAATLLVWYRSNDYTAMLVAFTLVGFSASQAGMVDAVVRLYEEILREPYRVLVGASTITGLIVLYVFPDGRFVPQWTRLVAIAWTVFVLVGLLISNVPTNPIDGPVWRATPWLSIATALGWFGSGVLAQLYRYVRSSKPLHRQQIKWTTTGLTFAVIGFLLEHVGVLFHSIPPGLSSTLYLLVRIPLAKILMMLAPCCIGFAVLRYRLWDIDILINRALVYSSLTASIVSIYILVVGSLSALFQTRGNLLISLFATTIVAIMFGPLRERLQRGINRLMYGERDDPYLVLARLGQHLEATLVPGAVPQVIVDTVAQTLKLPYAAIALETSSTQSMIITEPSQNTDSFTIIASSGKPVVDTEVFQLVYQSVTIGQLILGLRAPRESFGPADRRVISDLTRQIGVAIHAVRATTDLQRLNTDLQRLNVDLQRSRERLVTSIEEERGRLRDDLHDGFLSNITILIGQIEEALELFRSDPDQSVALLRQVMTEARTASETVRSMLYNLRPPVLDLGLSYALLDLGEKLQRRDFHVHIDVPTLIPPLHPAVDTAAYRIAQAALSNVEHHAAAHNCYLYLRLQDMLCLEIVDDGRGIQSTDKPGVGLASMRERAEQLGGSCIIERTSKGGTAVRIQLPFLLKDDQMLP